MTTISLQLQSSKWLTQCVLVTALHAVIGSVCLFAASKAAVKVLLFKAKLLILMQVGASIKHFVGLV